MGPLVAFLLGWSEHNAVAYESDALWLHIVSGTSGRDDRRGRLVPDVLLAAVLLPLYILVGVAVADRWDLLPAVLGLSVALLGAGYAVSSVMSVVMPYPVPAVGREPVQRATRRRRDHDRRAVDREPRHRRARLADDPARVVRLAGVVGSGLGGWPRRDRPRRASPASPASASAPPLRPAGPRAAVGAATGVASSVRGGPDPTGPSARGSARPSAPDPPRTYSYRV